MPFKMTAKQRREAISEAEQICAICDIEYWSDELATDHDHLTGQFRGILCRSCNTLLGHYHESFSALERDGHFACIHYLWESRSAFVGGWPIVWISVDPERNLAVAYVAGRHPVMRLDPDEPLAPWGLDRWAKGLAI